MGMAVCYEAMNRSIFGPCVFNSAAPDDGNMMVLEQVGTDDQKERLAPADSCRARWRSAFSMTEHPSRWRLGPLDDPHPARRKHGDTYRILRP